MVTSSSDSPNEPSSPRLALPRTPVQWLAVFGPGAIVASLTIGTGELIFSTRGGALFGYQISFLFVVISLLKWGLVLASTRHIILTGVHPYERMIELPGPRGWLIAVVFLIAAVCLPIWISFLSGVTGNLAAWVTQTKGMLGGGIDYLWGACILGVIMFLVATGGYSALERIQLFVVAAMVVCSGITLILYDPDWLAILKGAFMPQLYNYPDWLNAEYPAIANQPVWVETTRYVGVIGGASFDYLAYTSWVRDKGWGRSASGPVSKAELDQMAGDPQHPTRRWLRAPLVDCTISFMIVIAFSAVFVASGAILLGPNHRIPDEGNLLNLQSQFVTNLHPWLLPLYVVGAFLTMAGSLYGTSEVGCSIFSELVRSVNRTFAVRHARRIKSVVVSWFAGWAFVILIWLFVYQFSGGTEKPRLLLAILTPANLFTGVLGCGLVCALNVWIDGRYLPRGLRMPFALVALNGLSCAIFVALGLKGYWDDQSRWIAIGGLLAILAAGFIAASLIGDRVLKDRDE